MRNLVLTLSAALALVIGQQSFAAPSEAAVKLMMETPGGIEALKALKIEGATAAQVLENLKAINSGPNRLLIEGAITKFANEVGRGLDKELALHGAFYDSKGQAKDIYHLKAASLTTTASTTAAAAEPNCSVDRTVADFERGLTGSQVSEFEASIQQERKETGRLSFDASDACNGGVSQYENVKARVNYLKIRLIAAKGHFTRGAYIDGIKTVLGLNDVEAAKTETQFETVCHILSPAGA